jgi:multidrug efflux pump subunit AcrA (membrane-fusion protein)|tara:strand:+ start:400 stop:1377 length:978 start_codon:yes stop_codon:yes gene_type:complete
MKKFLKNISTKLKNSFNFINREKLEEIIPYLLPEFWASNKKSFLLFWFIGLFTIIFLVWASIAEVNQVVRAPGTVIPDSKVHLVQSGIAGPVEKINVKLDDEVNEGDTLYLVDNINSKKFFELAKKEFETRKRKVEILRNLVKSGSDSEFRLLDEELSLVEAEKRFNQAKRNLEFSSVKAPISGSISSAKVTNIGQLVKTGDLLSEIVPKDDMLKIEASVLPKDIAYVRKGQKAKIAFTAYDMAIYGQFEGVVTKIASNTTSTQDGATYYPAIIEIDYNQVNDSERKVILQSGMQSDVSIIGEERTVLSYVLNPITKLSQRALQE